MKELYNFEFISQRKVIVLASYGIDELQKSLHFCINIFVKPFSPSAETRYSMASNACKDALENSLLNGILWVGSHRHWSNPKMKQRISFTAFILLSWCKCWSSRLLVIPGYKCNEISISSILWYKISLVLQTKLVKKKKQKEEEEDDCIKMEKNNKMRWEKKERISSSFFPSYPIYAFRVFFHQPVSSW